MLTRNMLNCFKYYKRYIFTLHIISWILFNRRPDLQRSKPTYCLSYTVNIIPADSMATWGAQKSLGLTPVPMHFFQRPNVNGMKCSVTTEYVWTIVSSATEMMIVAMVLMKGIVEVRKWYCGKNALIRYHPISSISHTKSQNLNVSRLILQLLLLNPLKPGVKSRMKM